MKSIHAPANARLVIKYIDDNTALVSKAFAKKASYYGTPEFKLWREYKAEFPDAVMTTKSIKKNPDKKTNKNMTYKNMADFIRTQDNAKNLMVQFEIVVKRSKVQTNPYRSVLAWFEQTFKDYDSYKAYFAAIAEETEAEDNIFYLEEDVASAAVNE
ncbi:MAG: hypothetical protein IJ179_00475 [Oscillospiraceae bacterium]|nr:hypothetical protein [Oscillospiraceae bacterium]